MIAVGAVIAVLVVLAVVASLLYRRGNETVAATSDTTVARSTAARSVAPTTTTEPATTRTTSAATTRSTSTRPTTTPTTRATTRLWSPWTAPDNTFTLDFPGTAQFANVPVNLPYYTQVKQATNLTNTGVYLVVYADLAETFTVQDNAGVLNGMVDGALTSLPQFKLTERKLEPFAGMPSLAFAGASATDAAIEGRALISGQRIYLFTAGADRGIDPEFAHFLDSFHIL